MVINPPPDMVKQPQFAGFSLVDVEMARQKVMEKHPLVPVSVKDVFAAMEWKRGFIPFRKSDRWIGEVFLEMDKEGVFYLVRIQVHMQFGFDDYNKSALLLYMKQTYFEVFKLLGTLPPEIPRFRISHMKREDVPDNLKQTKLTDTIQGWKLPFKKKKAERAA